MDALAGCVDGADAGSSSTVITYSASSSSFVLLAGVSVATLVAPDGGAWLRSVAFGVGATAGLDVDDEDDDDDDDDADDDAAGLLKKLNSDCWPFTGAIGGFGAMALRWLGSWD